MEDRFTHEQSEIREISIEGAGSMARAFMANVFSYMTLALVITGVFSYWFSTRPDLLEYLVNFQTGSRTILGWIVMLAPIGFILLMGVRFQKFSFAGLLSTFIAFSIIMGISLSFVFLYYSGAVITKTFFVTAGTFAAMAILGYTTKADLTSMGKILYMVLIGLVIAMVVNWFMQSSQIDYIISIGGVIIFTGLTAYDTQKLKNIGMNVGYGTTTASKMAIMGAVSLYLDFINLFLFLLRLFGERD